jgi:hypothetical protein
LTINQVREIAATGNAEALTEFLDRLSLQDNGDIFEDCSRFSAIEEGLKHLLPHDNSLAVLAGMSLEMGLELHSRKEEIRDRLETMVNSGTAHAFLVHLDFLGDKEFMAVALDCLRLVLKQELKADNPKTEKPMAILEVMEKRVPEQTRIQWENAFSGPYTKTVNSRQLPPMNSTVWPVARTLCSLHLQWPDFPWDKIVNRGDHQPNVVWREGLGNMPMFPGSTEILGMCVLAIASECKEPALVHLAQEIHAKAVPTISYSPFKEMLDNAPTLPAEQSDPTKPASILSNEEPYLFGRTEKEQPDVATESLPDNVETEPPKPSPPGNTAKKKRRESARCPVCEMVYNSRSCVHQEDTEERPIERWLPLLSRDDSDSSTLQQSAEEHLSIIFQYTFRYPSVVESMMEIPVRFYLAYRQTRQMLFAHTREESIHYMNSKYSLRLQRDASEEEKERFETPKEAYLLRYTNVFIKRRVNNWITRRASIPDALLFFSRYKPTALYFESVLYVGERCQNSGELDVLAVFLQELDAPDDFFHAYMSKMLPSLVTHSEQEFLLHCLSLARGLRTRIVVLRGLAFICKRNTDKAGYDRLLPFCAL